MLKYLELKSRKHRNNFDNKILIKEIGRNNGRTVRSSEKWK